MDFPGVTPATMRQLNPQASLNARWFALLFLSVLLVAAFVVSVSRTLIGPTWQSFVPMCGTLWGAADLLTAYLLFSQTRVTSDKSYIAIGIAYLTMSLLTLPYVLFFPGTFGRILVHDYGNVSIWLWATWHFAFPIIIGGYHLIFRSPASRAVGGNYVRRLIAGCAVTTVCLNVVIAYAIIALRTHLPLLIENGLTFTTLFTNVITPIVVLLNAGAAIVLFTISSRPTVLQLWLGIALVSAALDGFSNSISVGRFSVPWYFGKMETIVTATTVLVVLLIEISGLYAELGRLAYIDPLTELHNRRTFDDYFDRMLCFARRSRGNIAFLIADVDLFKQFNDFYGHAAGDECLRRIAKSFRTCLTRDSDIVARYGGEEFVALLPGTDLSGAMAVAERLRKSIETLGIPHAKSTVSSAVTISIGVFAAQAGRRTEALEFYNGADRALYKAKARRNHIASLDDPVVL